jgi:hypothetical protein
LEATVMMATITKEKLIADLTDEEISELRRDAQRYRKLKAELEFCPLRTGLISRRGDFCFVEGRFDSAVDSLRDPNGKKPTRRTR